MAALLMTGSRSKLEGELKGEHLVFDPLFMWDVHLVEIIFTVTGI